MQHRNLYQKQYYSTRKRRKTRKRRILWLLIVAIMVSGIGFVVRFQQAIIAQVPEVDSVDDFVHFAQSSELTDRNGEKLYTLFEENRKLIEYDEISDWVIDAAIATENKSFRTDDGLDYMGIIKVGFKYGLYKLGLSDDIRGASTITQQVIKNLLLDSSRTVERKMKERVLTRKLDEVTEDHVQAKYGELPPDQLKRKQKELIMEIYMNMVFLGNNAYGVEAAANKYFATSADKIWLVEWAILAGIIQAPGRYNPYTNKIRNKQRSYCDINKMDQRAQQEVQHICQGAVGGLVLRPTGSGVVATGARAYAKEIFVNKIKPLSLEVMDENKRLRSWLWGEAMTITYEGSMYELRYAWGRKDDVLFRMYDERYIDGKQLKQAIIDGIGLDLESKEVDIKAPHFVFRVKDYILNNKIFEQAGITKEMLMQGGLTIQTSLDYTLQKAAKQTVYDNKSLANEYGASNRAFLYADSSNGDVLAYVGSLDYNNEAIDGKVDMIQAARQPWSSIKPLVYALWLQTVALTIDTPMFDIPMKIGDNVINNFDGEFFGLQPLRKALAASRNIPAVKMFFALGGEDKLKPFLQDMGMKALRNDREYGYSLWLGAGEVPMLQLAQAYAHLSTLGKPAEINPILKITGPEGEILYEKKPRMLPRVVEKGPAYLIWDILSNDANMPEGRPASIRVYGFPNGTKSGTSNVKDEKGTSKSRDAWLVLYTPSKVALSWAGNADSSPMDGYGGTLNAPVLKQFFDRLQEQGYIVQEDHRPVEVSTVKINKISGKRTTSSTPAQFTTSSYAYNNQIPTQQDPGMQQIRYDTLCNGKVSQFTPQQEIQKGRVIQPQTFMPSGRDLEDVKQWRRQANGTASGGQQDDITYQYTNMFLEAPTSPCESRIPKEDLSIQLAIAQTSLQQPSNTDTMAMQYSVRADRYPIRSVMFFVDGVAQHTIDTARKKLIIDTAHIPLPSEFNRYEDHTIKIMAIDTHGFENHKEYTVTFAQDTQKPWLETSQSIVQPQGSGYEVSLLFADDAAGIQQGKIIIDQETMVTFEQEGVTFALQELGKVGYIVRDRAGNQRSDVVDIRELTE